MTTNEDFANLLRRYYRADHFLKLGGPWDDIELCEMHLHHDQTSKTVRLAKLDNTLHSEN